jgi:hypothetical protein
MIGEYMSDKYPEYVRLHNTAMRQYGTTTDGLVKYWRVHGAWGMGSKFVDGKLVAVSLQQQTHAMEGDELVEITKEEYLEDEGFKQ